MASARSHSHLSRALPIRHKRERRDSRAARHSGPTVCFRLRNHTVSGVPLMARKHATLVSNRSVNALYWTTVPEVK